MATHNTQAELAIANPEYAAAITISDLTGDHKYTHTTILAQAISDRSNNILTVAKRTLTAQISTLDATFNYLITQAAKQKNPQTQADLFDLALTAQARCREAIVALSQLPIAPLVEPILAHGAESHGADISKPVKAWANSVIESQLEYSGKATATSSELES